MYSFKTDFGEAIPTEVVAYDGTPGRLLHNRYALLYNDVVQAALRARGISPPLVWTRSTWAGGQRHPIQWSGDSNCTWEDLATTLRSGLSMAMSGHSFWSHDIGGFAGTPEPELCVRWAQFGLLSPFSRFHGTTSRAPWDFGEDAERAVKHVAMLRMSLIPHLRALAAESIAETVPMMRPVAFDYPELPEATAADLQYLLGPDLLVAPFFRPGGKRRLWFPPGTWTHYMGSSTYQGPAWMEISLSLEEAPLFVRKGALIGACEARMSMGDSNPLLEHLIVAIPEDRGPHRLQGRILTNGDELVNVKALVSGDTIHIQGPLSASECKVRAFGRRRIKRAWINGEEAEVWRVANICPN